MKQYISEEQFNELTPEQEKKFIEWTASKGSHPVTVAHLLWFLEEHTEGEPIEIVRTSDGYWHVSIHSMKHRYNEKVFIDQLWNAVKDILSEDEEAKA